MSIVAEMLRYIGMHWVEWAFVALTSITGVLYRKMLNGLKETQSRDKSISDGMVAILRSQIVDKYNYYSDKGYCPIYAKEVIAELYTPYKELGGNGVVKNLVEELNELPNISTERRTLRKN